MDSVTTAEEYRAFFAEVFAMMDADPRKRKMKVRTGNLTIDFVGGNPVFKVADSVAAADFRCRWLPEHPVPVVPGGRAVFSFVPTSGNRVKVRIR